jgi:uncharacterized protein (DUF2141 family)
MFKASKIFNILLFPLLLLILFTLSGTRVQVFAEEDVLTPSYNWIPQFYGKIKGKSKLLYTRSFARSQLRFVDIDNDGDEDLFVGKADGRIAFFVNQGSSSVPLFELQTEDFVVIHEGIDEQNKPTLLKTVLDVGSNAAPEFADIDDDGDFDLFIGSKDGHIFHYENRGNQLSPIFFRKTPIYMGLKFGGNIVPRFADVNGDRALDLLIGTRSGKVHIFFNSGMTDEAVFCAAFNVAEPPDLRCKYQPELLTDIAPQIDAVPELVDWDQDKDLDLVVGKSNGKINYYLNSGDRFAPQWRIKSKHFQFIDGGGNVAPTFKDLNHDNFPELFLGTSSSMVIYYENNEVLMDQLSKVSDLQLEKLDKSASFENILSQACKQLRGLPECLTTLAVAFGVPAEVKITGMEELQPYILRPDLSVDNNLDEATLSTDSGLAEKESGVDIAVEENSEAEAEAKPANEGETGENSVQTDAAITDGEKDAKTPVINKKIEKLKLQGVITRNQLWLASRNFFKIESLSGSQRHSNLTSGDWNKDGRLDILMGSRSGEIFAFENRAESGTDWYPIHFPALKKNKRQYSSPVLADIDGDGDLDIISGNKSGKLELLLNRGSAKKPEWIVHDLNISQIDVGSFSTPLLQDMDGDADLDLLVGNSKGLIIYYENQGSKTAPSFVLRNTRISGIQLKANAAPTFWKWNSDEHADLVVGGREGFLSLLSHLPPKRSPALRGWNLEAANWQNIKSIGYSTPHFADFSGDNKTDLMLGDEEGNLLFWKNGGIITKEDNEEKSTLILTENILEVEEEKEEQPEKKIAFEAPVTVKDPEENEPIDPKFEFVSAKYGNLELGRRAFPAFMDIDGDNKLDLIVGNKAGELRYYRREQNSVEAEWTLESNHFLDYRGGKNSAPVFTDLDGDADLDLLVGNQQGSIQYWENKGNYEVADFVYNPTPFIGVTGGRNSVPAVIDLNADGLNDLLVGNFLGQLYKYERTGISNGFRFQLEIRKYLNLDVGLGAVPIIADLNNDQQPELIIGSDSGKIKSFQLIPENAGSINWEPSPEYFKELKLPVGGNPVFVDLDNDGDLDLIIGSEAGTLYYFRNTGS